MENAKEILAGFVEQAEKIIIEFNVNEKKAAESLSKFKRDLEKGACVSLEEKELFDACVYNALATVNTVLVQEKKSQQLLMALTEAKEEIKAIMEFL